MSNATISELPIAESRARETTRGLSRILLLMSGSVFGQLAIIGSMPIITRIYTPSEMGLYAVFTAIIGFVSTVVALHYELAIPLPKHEFHARLVIGLSLGVVGIMGLLSLGVLTMVGHPLLAWAGAAQLEPLTGIISLSLVVTGCATILAYWSLRLMTYRTNALAKLLQGIIQPLSQIAFGISGYGVRGLIFGALLGQCGAIYALGRGLSWRWLGRLWLNHSSKVLMLARRYRDFPLMAAPSSILNGVIAQMPVLLLAAWFDTRVAGLYALGFRILQAPLKVVADALSQVFFGMATEAHRIGTLNLITGSIWRAQMILALYSFIPLALVAPEIFSVVFGREWREAGLYAQYLMPWLMASFLVTSLSILVSVLQQQKREFIFQVAYLSTVLGIVWFGHLFGNERLTLKLLGIGGGLFLSGKAVWLLHIAKVEAGSHLRWLTRETFLIGGLALLLVVLKGTMHSEALLVITTGVIVTIAHCINYFVRRVYVF